MFQAADSVGLGSLGAGFQTASAAPRLVTVSVRAKRLVKLLPGSSGCGLVQLEDDSYCVVKFRDNPHGGRVLINDWIGNRLAQRVGLPVARPLRVTVDASVCEQWPGPPNRVSPGIHFGSRTPVDPTRQAIYGNLPPTLLGKISNLHSARATWAFDLWIRRTDGGQGLFTSEAPSASYRALVFDYGCALGGPEWDRLDAAPPLRSWQRFAFCNALAGTHEETVRAILGLRYDDLLAAADEVPEEWFCSAQEKVRLRQEVLVDLEKRRKELPRALEAQAPLDCR